MSKFIQLTLEWGQEIYLSVNSIVLVWTGPGGTTIEVNGPLVKEHVVKQSVEEVMALINGDSKPTDYPNVAPGGLKLAWTTYSDGETAAAVVRHELRIARKIAAYHLACAEHLHRLLVGMEGV